MCSVFFLYLRSDSCSDICTCTCAGARSDARQAMTALYWRSDEQEGTLHLKQGTTRRRRSGGGEKDDMIVHPKSDGLQPMASTLRAMASTSTLRDMWRKTRKQKTRNTLISSLETRMVMVSTVTAVSPPLGECELDSQSPATKTLRPSFRSQSFTVRAFSMVSAWPRGVPPGILRFDRIHHAPRFAKEFESCSKWDAEVGPHSGVLLVLRRPRSPRS